MTKQIVRVPARLEAKRIEDDTQVSTDLSVSRTYSADQLNSIQGMGAIKVNGDQLKGLGEVGRIVGTRGLVDILNGGTVISAQNLSAAIAFLGMIVAGEPDETGKIPTRAERQKATRDLGYLSGALARAAANATKGVRDVAEVAIQADKQFRQSFQPGMVINVQDKPPVK